MRENSHLLVFVASPPATTHNLHQSPVRPLECPQLYKRTAAPAGASSAPHTSSSPNVQCHHNPALQLEPRPGATAAAGSHAIIPHFPGESWEEAVSDTTGQMGWQHSRVSSNELMKPICMKHFKEPASLNTAHIPRLAHKH